jgi:hypothetical protein
MYTVYRTFREDAGQNMTFLCERSAGSEGKLWKELEVSCQPTVITTQPVILTEPSVTDSADNTTAVNTSQSVQFNTTVQRGGSVQKSSQEDWHSPSTSVLIFVGCFAAVVFVAVVAISVVIRRLRAPVSNDLWWEDVVSRKELMSK